MVRRAVAEQLFKPVEFQGDQVSDFAGMAEWYCQMVVNRKVNACMRERQACLRFLHMLQEAKKPACEYYFSPNHVADICGFTESLQHSKGFEGYIVLEPVQIWWLAACFGFREKDTDRRWVREIALWVPRKNGKTELVKSIVLYCLNYEGERGADGAICAGSENQARIPYKAITSTLDAEPDLKDWLIAKHTLEKAVFKRTGAELLLLAGRAPNLDGLNPHIVLAEEVHAQHQEVIGVLKTAQGARTQPMWVGISTAGRSTVGAAYDGWRSDQQILEGKVQASRVFVAMYEPDDGDADRRFDPQVVEKLNPLYGVALQAASLETEVREARKSPSKLQEYLRTRLNVWARAAGNLLSVEKWNACGDPTLDLDAFKGYPLYVGFDLASAGDLNSAAFEVEVEGTLYVITRHWIPERSPRFDDDRFSDQFTHWRDTGALTVTKGTHVHHPTILHDVLKMIEGHNVAGLAFDRFQADYLMGEMEGLAYPVFTVSKSARDITRATDDLIARHQDTARLQHDANPVTSWMAGNVVGYYDQNDNVMAKKEKQGSPMSIDGIDATINGNAARMADDAGIMGEGVKKIVPNPYLTRGLAGMRDER